MSEHKNASYISAKESRKITRFNRRVTKKLEQEREAAGKDPSLYTTVMKDPNNVVEFDNVCTYFFADNGVVKAVDGVNFAVPKCSTVGGQIRFNLGDGTAYDIVKTPTSKMQEIRGNKISMIFQEPMTSLNPVFRIGFQVDEVIKLHNPEMSDEDVKARTLQMLDLVGIANREGVYKMYPHELSGGMRQRIMIAIALACSPTLIIADEPTTALDVTIQAQILDLLQGLKDKLNSSIMLITHDLGVVAGMADYVVVMYAGRVVEKGTADDIFHHPMHPYTIGLMRSKPVVGRKVDELYNIPGSVPNPVDMPNYCYFRDRCEMHCERCSGLYPPEIKVSDTHVVSCYRYYDEGEVLDYPKSVNVEEL